MNLFKMSQVLIGQALAAVTGKVSFELRYRADGKHSFLRLIERVVCDTLVSSFTRTMAGMTLLTYRKTRDQALHSCACKSFPISTTTFLIQEKLWLHTFVVQISCSELYWFVFRVKCGSSYVGTTPRSCIVLGCASRLWREANVRAKYVITFEGHATRNRAQNLLSSGSHANACIWLAFLVFVEYSLLGNVYVSEHNAF